MNVTGTPDPNYGVTAQAGFAFKPLDTSGNPIGDGSYWDALTVYNNTATDTSIPAGTNGPNYVITTDDIGPFGNCLEFAMVYSNGLFPGVTGTDDRLAVWDFCANSGQGAWGNAMQINASFLSTYVRTFSNGDGHPQAIVQSVRYPDGTWHALLYNDTNGMYDDFYHSAAATSTMGDGTGASMFFALYSTNTNCPNIDVVGQSGFRLYTGTGTDNGYAELWSLGAGAYQVNNGVGPCFQPLATNGNRPQVPYYLYVNGLSTQPNDSAWGVEMGT